MADVIHNPYLPYTGPIPQPFQPGYMIRVQGTVKPSPTCFSINLQNDASTMPRNDVALHLSPVFTPPPRLVRNSIQGGQWGPEESHGSFFPFSAGQGFEIIILADPDKFKIAVNGQHFTEFTYRLPMHMITHISIDGDADISSIKFDRPYGSSPTSQEGKTVVTGPLGFVIPGGPGAPNLNSPSGGYGVAGGAVPYPSNSPYPPQSSGSVYPPQSSGVPYPSQPAPSLYPPSPHSGRTSPVSPYGPMPASSPYGPPPASNPYGPPVGGYPSVPPSSPTSYPGHSYPSQPGPYPGTTVVYPGQENQKSGSSNLNALAAGAAAVAGAAGAALMGGHKHKGGKHGHSFNPATALLGGGGVGHGGPTAMLASGMGSLLGGGKHHGPKHSTSSSIPIGGALAGGAAALAGAYMLSKSPIGKVMKPKKMKKLYKHKHKIKHGFKGFGSSSSSSSSSEEE